MEDELKKVIRRKLKIDYITMSGSGEPTLHKDLDKIISSLKKVTSNKIPICLITNSSLLYRKKVRLELKEADLIIPSLDGATSGVFAKINKQDSKVGFQKVIQGLVALRKEFKGKIWLEIMLIKGINDSALQAQAFKKIIQKIKPDKVQLNLPVRPSRLKVNLPELKKVKMFKRILGKSAKIVANFPNQETGDLNFLKKRPILF
jgi:wyosine [tRNA(Phe)-imidazoG37] synthetase (radical SAM superfamily)